jgi:hypothetical protein
VPQTHLDSHSAAWLEQPLAADQRQQAAAGAPPRQLSAALRQPRAVHLRDAAAGHRVQFKAAKQLRDGGTEGVFYCCFCVAVGMPRSLGLQRRQRSADILREEVWPRGCPLAPFDEGRA